MSNTRSKDGIRKSPLECNLADEKDLGGSPEGNVSKKGNRMK